jgi:hypothetical protein
VARREKVGHRPPTQSVGEWGLNPQTTPFAFHKRISAPPWCLRRGCLLSFYSRQIDRQSVITVVESGEAMPQIGKPSKPLPTVRISLPKQIEILRAFGAACGPIPRPVTNAEVGKIVDLKPETIALGSPFFVAIDLLTKVEGGYVPSEEVLNYARSFEWVPEEAFDRLEPKFRKTWFAEAILPRLRFAPVSEDQAKAILGEAASLSASSGGQLEMLLGFMVEARLIEQENGTYRIAKPRLSEELPAKDDDDDDDERLEEKPPILGGSGIRMAISFDVDMEEMSKWTPDRISAFMSGLAQVLSAKGNLDRAAV